MPRLIKFSEVAERLGLSRPTIYKILARDPTFPKPIHVTPTAPRFRAEDIEAWLEKRTAA